MCINMRVNDARLVDAKNGTEQIKNRSADGCNHKSLPEGESVVIDFVGNIEKILFREIEDARKKGWMDVCGFLTGLACANDDGILFQHNMGSFHLRLINSQELYTKRLSCTAIMRNKYAHAIYINRNIRASYEQSYEGMHRSAAVCAADA